MSTYASTPAAAAAPNSTALAIDTLIRRELKVGDPKDPQQVARALAERYQGDLRAQAISGEAKGLPFLNTPILRAPEQRTQTASDVDLDQAREDVNIDLDHLLRDNLTKDMRPELEGWQSVIQRSIDEGVAAARYGLDPHRRDTAFAMRRQLGEYARLARLVGVLTPALNRSFRDLAISLDEVSSVLLVLLGESMANLGFSGGRFLLQAPYAELQARRDAVLNALRQVDGVSAMVGANETWPRGLRAYRQLSTVLEARGQGDLRSLMNEAELGRTLDELVQLASGGTPHGLRAVGATAWAPLNRLQRFVQTTLRQVAPASHELATLHEALLLFLEGFVPAGGFRLLRVARPTVLNYGLYGTANVTAAERRLIELVNRRGTLARALDCLTQCACDRDTVLAQIALDSVLQDIDRAVDYYCLGDADLGLPEVRAAAFSHLIDAVLPGAPMWPWNWLDDNNVVHPVQQPAYLSVLSTPATVQIAVELAAVRDLLRPNPIGVYPQAFWWDPANTRAVYDANVASNNAWLGGAPSALRFAQVLHDELCLQRDTDQQWRAVIEQMTTGCVPADEVFRDGLPPAQPRPGCLPHLVDRALDDIDARTNGAVSFACTPEEPVLPPHFEESLNNIAQQI